MAPGSGDAYFRLAPPLLNRFEKQIFLRKDGHPGDPTWLTLRQTLDLLEGLDSAPFKNTHEKTDAGSCELFLIATSP